MDVLQDPKFNFGEIMNKHKHLSVLINILEQNKDNKEMLGQIEKVVGDLIIENKVKIDDNIIPTDCNKVPCMCLATYDYPISLKALESLAYYGISANEVISHYQGKTIIKAANVKADIQKIIDSFGKDIDHLLIQTNSFSMSNIIDFFFGLHLHVIDISIYPLTDGRSIMHINLAWV